MSNYFFKKSSGVSIVVMVLAAFVIGAVIIGVITVMMRSEVQTKGATGSVQINLVPADPTQLGMLPSQGTLTLTGKNTATRKVVRFALKKEGGSRIMRLRNLPSDIYTASIAFVENVDAGVDASDVGIVAIAPEVPAEDGSEQPSVYGGTESSINIYYGSKGSTVADQTGQTEKKQCGTINPKTKKCTNPSDAVCKRAGFEKCDPDCYCTGSGTPSGTNPKPGTGGTTIPGDFKGWCWYSKTGANLNKCAKDAPEAGAQRKALCRDSDECKATATTKHSECVNKFCREVSGPGGDQCTPGSGGKECAALVPTCKVENGSKVCKPAQNVGLTRCKTAKDCEDYPYDPSVLPTPRNAELRSGATPPE